MPRLFVAVEVPGQVKQAIAALGHGLTGARWLPAGQLHLTIRFLGEVDAAQSTAIESGLPEGGLAPFSCLLSGVGCFPAPGRPRIVYVQVNAGPGLGLLRSAVEARLADLGLHPEPGRFSPHITLARLKCGHGNVGEVRDFLARHAQFKCPPFVVNTYHLYESRLTPGGAIHTRRRSYHLAYLTPPHPRQI